MQNKLQELTDKIYNEGVSKGKEEAEKIISDANAKAEKIISDAQAQSQSIIKKAQDKADELDHNTQSELKLASKQIINTVKQQITDIITDDIVSAQVGEALKDSQFMKSIIEKIASNWQSNDATSADLNIILPEAEKAKMDSFIKNEAKKLIEKGVAFSFSKELKSGFQLSPKDGGYKVSFSEEEFGNYFKEYLRPKLIELLFGEKV